MRQAAILAGDALTSAIKLLKPGIMENEVAAEIEYQMRKGGASGPAFETIVAFGGTIGVASCASYRQAIEEK